MKTRILSLSCCLILAACGGDSNVRKQLGLDKEAPDEFAVVTRAPLEVPPDYTLRPPRPGADRPMEIQPAEQAKQTVFGKSSEQLITSRSLNANSSGARALLEKAGADQADPNIREVLVAEDEILNKDDGPTAEKLMFWRGGDAPAGEALDPVEELQRIQDEADDAADISKRNEVLPTP